jgi:S1-C subfamily serine protease
LGALVALVLAAGAVSAAPAADPRAAMVKIFTVQDPPSYQTPWNREGPGHYSGSGCIVAGGRILTNAHVVSDQTFLQVRRTGRARKHTARVVAVSHDADLALLAVDDPAFAEGVTALEFGELPEVRETVAVYGFPEGGDTLSITEGVISRIEHSRYAHSTIELLAAQIDAAVNPGNSGGPVIHKRRVVGVVMQILQNSEGIGYMVPMPVVRHFLDDVADGRYDGFPEDGILFQPMENGALRRRHGLGAGDTGVLVTWVRPGMPGHGKILPGDVITAVDGHAVGDDGTVEFRPGERTRADHFTQMHQVGETLQVGLRRGGRPMTLPLRLDRPWGANMLVPRLQYDRAPSYYIYGGLVFSTLTLNYLMTWGEKWENDAPGNLLHLLINDRPEVAGEEAVVLINVLPSEINAGYEAAINARIVTVNGRKVRNLADLVRIVEGDGTSGPFVEFVDAHGHAMVLERKAAADARQEILGTYAIAADRSPDLR